MTKELPHYYIGNEYGGNQDLLRDHWMRLGGCAALTACDSSIYFAKHLGMDDLYPYDSGEISREDYARFSQIMKPYLRPRFGGIDRTSIFVEGYQNYLRDRHCETIQVHDLAGTRPYQEAAGLFRSQIDQDLPVPCLVLKHKNPRFCDFTWHWFLLNGYSEENSRLLAKAATYGHYEWLDFEQLWDSGYQKTGGLILFDLK